MRIRDLPLRDPGIPDARSGPRFLLWLLRQQRRGLLAGLLWGTLHLSAVAFTPFAIGIAVQAVVDRSGERLAFAGALLLGLGLLSATSDTFLHRVAVTNWVSVASRVQQLLARKTAELGSQLTRRVAAGEVVAVSTGDVEKIGWFVECLSRFGAAVVSLLAVSTALVLYQPALGAVVAVGTPVVALAVLPLLPAATRRAEVQRDRAGRATELAADTVAGLRVLRGIGGEELFLARYRGASQRVRRAAVRSAWMWSLISGAQVALPGLLLLAVVGLGVRAAADGSVTPGQLVTVYGAVLFLLNPLRHVEEVAMAYSFSRPSARRAARVLALRRPTPTGAPSAAPATDVPTAGELRDPVSGLLAPAGELTAVVCDDPDVAGRLAERLGGQVADGDGDTPSVLLDGVALDALPLAVARKAVLVQDKDPVLLSGTLAELLDVPSSGRVSAREALRAARCGDVLDALVLSSADADGDPMRAQLTERGRSLSGGQRQRLALARSLLADPPVLVLDEPTSAVDAHTEVRIADGLRRLRRSRTTVVFTSSPLLLARADRVALVHGGEVVASGRHEALLREDARYRAAVAREPTEPAGERTDGTAASLARSTGELEESA